MRAITNVKHVSHELRFWNKRGAVLLVLKACSVLIGHFHFGNTLEFWLRIPEQRGAINGIDELVNIHFLDRNLDFNTIRLIRITFVNQFERTVLILASVGNISVAATLIKAHNSEAIGVCPCTLCAKAETAGL